MNDYGTITFFIIVIEVLLLSFQTFSFLARTNDKSRMRFLLLIVHFLVFNLFAGVMPNATFLLPLMIQHLILFAVGVWLATYYFYYLVNETDIIQVGTFTVKKLIVYLSLPIFSLYLLACYFLEDVTLARKIVLGVPLIIGSYFCYKSVQFLIQKWRALTETKTPYGTLLIACNIGIIFMALMPITCYFDHCDFTVATINVSLLVSTYAYIKNYMFQSRLEYQFLNKIGFYSDSNLKEKDDILVQFRNYNLTSRELDIALLIFQEKPYKEIAEQMFIAPKTVSKHASNIFKKTNTSRRSNFIERFQSETKMNGL